MLTDRASCSWAGSSPEGIPSWKLAKMIWDHMAACRMLSLSNVPWPAASLSTRSCEWSRPTSLALAVSENSGWQKFELSPPLIAGTSPGWWHFDGEDGETALGFPHQKNIFCKIFRGHCRAHLSASFSLKACRPYNLGFYYFDGRWNRSEDKVWQ